jgi:hypothetical protein
MAEANRWLHVRHPRGFTPEQFDCFKAHCRVWQAYVEAVLREWEHFRDYPAPRYEFFEPTLSADRRVATLPVGGEWVLGTRAEFENAGSRLLWERFPLEFQLELEEGITEPDFADATRSITNWRRPLGSPA